VLFQPIVEILPDLPVLVTVVNYEQFTPAGLLLCHVFDTPDDTYVIMAPRPAIGKGLTAGTWHWAMGNGLTATPSLRDK